MNSLERLIASGKGEPLDCPPVAPGIGHYAAIKAGKPMTQVAFNPELMAEVMLRSVTRHGHDSCSPITDYGLGTECMGSRVVIRDWEQTFVDRFAVESEADVAHLKLPDPLRDGRMPVILECERILVEAVGNRVGVNGGLSGPLSFAANLRGPQAILWDLIDRPGMVHQMLEIAAQAAESFAIAQLERGGVKTINIYEPMATMISNRMVDDFCFAYLQPVIAAIHTRGGLALLHICNDTTRLLERMVAIGADILSLDVQVDLAEAKQIVKGRAGISGNVATQLLATGTPEQVYTAACDCLRAAAQGGRYTLGSSCEVPYETPEANIDAMVRAARSFGAEWIKNEAS